MEHRATVEDLMYAAVLEKFLSLGVDMLGNMDNIMEKVLFDLLHTVTCLGVDIYASFAATMQCDKHIRNQSGWPLSRGKV